MSSRLDEREIAVAAADATCPRCGALREAGQRYCLECGLALPIVEGSIPGLRRRWLRRIGWYPGDWVWISLLTLLVAALGAAAAIAVSEERESGKSNVFTAPTESVAVAEPTFVPTRPPADTSKLPTAPEPKTSGTAAAGSRNGRLHWPVNENGWTIVLVSYPKTTGRPSALATAARGAKSGLRQVGILDSGRFASLQPGYYVVFSGIYAAKADADAGVGTARGAGFGGAYSRQIAR